MTFEKFDQSNNKMPVSYIDGLATVATTGDYDDLIDKPTIPTATSQLTNDSGFITSSAIPTNYVTTDTLQTISGSKFFTGEFHVNSSTNNSIRRCSFVDRIRFDGGIDFKNVTPHCFTKNGLNESGTKFEYDLPDQSGIIALASDIPTATSDLTNDSGFITSSAIPTNVSAFTNDAGYITNSALTNYVTTNTAQTITGDKTLDFDNTSTYNNVIYTNQLDLTKDANYGWYDLDIRSSNSGYTWHSNLSYEGLTTSFSDKLTKYTYDGIYYVPQTGTAYTYNFPAANGTLALTNDIYYKNGDTFKNSDYMNSTGYVTGAGKQMQYTIYTSKRLDNISSITIKHFSCVFRGINGYVNGNSYIDYATTSGYNMSVSMPEKNVINITIYAPNGYTGVNNNTPVNAVFPANGIELTFNE